MAGEVPGRAHAGGALFAGGFRPFFLGAAAYGAVAVLLWVAAYAGWLALPTPWPGPLWHGHELVFGFAAAAIAGFLLTAVPKWTDSRPVTGVPLGLLFGAWLAGRVVCTVGDAIPDAAVAMVDLAFFPLLILAVTPPIVRARRARNYGFPVMLTGLFAANLVMHLDAAGAAPGLARPALLAAVYVVVTMVAVVSGRIVPTFTANALARRGDPRPVTKRDDLGRLAVAAAVVAFAAEVAGLSDPWRGTTAAVAAVLLAARAWGWRGLHTLREPLVLVLHEGHAFLILGFVLGAAAAFDVPRVLPSAALHAFTAGAIGVMVAAVTTRATLGHTGRPLRATPAMLAAYALVTLGALVRVLGPMLAPALYLHAIIAGGALFAVGFVFEAVAIAPMVWRPRVDGRPG